MRRPPAWPLPVAAASVLAASLAAPPGGWAPLLAAMPAAGLLALMPWLARRLGAPVRGPWPWLAALGVCGLLVRASRGAEAPTFALVLLACTAAATSLPGRWTAALAGLALAQEATRLAWLDGPPAPGLLGERALALVALPAATAFLTARLRAKAAAWRERVDELSPRERMASESRTASEPAGSPPPAARDQAAGGAAVERGDGRGGLDRLLELARRSLRATSCVLYERSVDPPGWLVAGAASVAPDFDGLAAAPLGRGLIAWAAKHGVPFRLSEPGPQLRDVPHLSGDSVAASFLAVPLSDGPAGRPREAEGDASAWAVLACDSPVPRRFDATAEELLLLHAEALSDRMALLREVRRRGHEARVHALLPRAASRVADAAGLDEVARRLLAESLGVAGAEAGAIVFDDARPPGAAAEEGGEERGAGPLILAATGLEVEAGHRLDPREETWARWCARHPDTPVRIPAFRPDRGMPRVARDDGLEASWSFAAWPLPAREGAVSPGALALAWPDRQLPEEHVLMATGLLATVGGACLIREEAEARLKGGREIDGVTGLPTRSALLKRGAALVADLAAHRGRLSVACFDLDGSGQLLEAHGPGAWDEAVEALGRTLTAALPASALVFRWAADEFVALLPGAGPEGIGVAARRAQAAVRQVGLLGREATVSAGTATLALPAESFEHGLARALAALEVARQVGGGKLVDAQPART